MNIAIVVSEFNQTITENLLAGALSRLNEFNINENHITVIKVPGAIEIPLTAQLLAKQNKYAAIICLGAVIRGETGHYQYVCEQVSQGCQHVMLKFEVPVIFGVLTTDTEEQAEARSGGLHGHKGKDSVDAAMQMVAIIKKLKTGTHEI